MSKLVAAGLIVSGLATRYAPDTMSEVVQNRVRWGQVDLSVEHDGYVALLDAEHIGRTVYLEMPDGTVSGPHLVADCAQEKHRGSLIERGWAVDLSYELAMELGVTNGPLPGVRVWDSRPGQVRWQ